MFPFFVCVETLKLHMWLAKKKAITPGLTQVKIHTHSLGQRFSSAFPHSLGQLMGLQETQQPGPCTKPDYKP